MKLKRLFRQIQEEVELNKLTFLFFLIVQLKCVNYSFCQICNENFKTADTICGLFYFENLVDAYVEADVILKSGGFISYMDSITVENYINSYVVFDNNLINIQTSFDTETVKIFKSELRLSNIYEPTNINPFCGVYLKLFYLKMIVTPLPASTERIPILKDCVDFQNNEIKYQEKEIKKRAIIEIIDYELLKE